MILDMQRRARELGRIRLGEKGAKGQPQKLDRFRVTSASQSLIEKVAALYGGTVKPWTPQGGTGQWEVITDATRLPILVPPQPVTQWLETWTGGGCVHRCDGVTNVLTDEPCDPDSPDHANAKPTTRLNVILRDVEAIGVFRVESHGWNAAAELPFIAEFLSHTGGYVSAWLALEERVTKKIKDGKSQTNRFMVPTIEVDGLTPAQVMAGQGAVAAITAPDVPQIESGRRDWLDGIDDANLTVDELRARWMHAKADGAGPETLEIIAERAKQAAPVEPTNGAQSRGAESAIWQECLTLAGQLNPPLTLDDVRARFVKINGISPSEGQLSDFERLRDGLRLDLDEQADLLADERAGVEA